MTGLQPFDPGSLALIALLNPAVAIVGFLMGRAANQPQKLIVAGFVAALAGAALVWIAAFVKLLPARGVGGEAGLFMIMFVVGLVWSAIGYWFSRNARK